MTQDITERLHADAAEWARLDKTVSGPRCAELQREAAAEIERLRAALRDAHGLIDNDLVIPWIIAHQLDDVLGINEQTARETDG